MDLRTFVIALGLGLSGGFIFGGYMGFPEVGVILSVSYIGAKITGILYEVYGVKDEE